MPQKIHPARGQSPPRTLQPDEPLFFGLGIESVFPGEFATNEKELIYERIRCGMYHSGLTKKGALIDGNYPKPIQIEGDLVKVNPHRLSTTLNEHFRKYVALLKQPESGTERTHFEQMFNKARKV